MINVKIKDKSGVKLLTKDKFCKDDINVTVDEGLLGSPVELSTSAEMEAVLIQDNIGKIYKYIGETNETFTNGNLYQVMEVE